MGDLNVSRRVLTPSLSNLERRQSGRVLVVDDEVGVAQILERGLHYAGYQVQVATGGREAVRLLHEHTFDAMITDIQMPHLRGDELQRIARKRDPFLAVVMVTAARDISIALDCLRDGVYDYVTKPFDLADVVLRVGKALERRRLEQRDHNHQIELEQRVTEQAEKLAQMTHGSLAALIHALEAKDPHTRNHSARVATLATRLALAIAPQDYEFSRRVHIAALFHDIGKIGVSEAVLNKPGVLSDEETRQVRQHPIIGETILRPLLEPEVVAMVRSHHEHLNGKGYPDGLRGDEIPLGGRIVAVADAYDALTSPRAYRSEVSRAGALQLLRAGAGGQWDGEVVATLLSLPGAECKEQFHTAPACLTATRSAEAAPQAEDPR